MENKCPKCRYRILFKNVPEVTRWVSASVPDGNMANRIGLKKYNKIKILSCFIYNFFTIFDLNVNFNF